MAEALLGFWRRRGPNLVRLSLVFGSVIAINAVHEFIPHTRLLWHNFFQWIYYLPVLYVAIRFGLRIGLAVAALASVGYIPHLLASPEGYPTDYVMVQYAAVFMLLTVSAITGIMADRERQRSKELQVAMDELSRAHETLKSLAGGIAHNFNNLLTVILGYAHLASGSLPSSSPVQEQIKIIRQAGDRAAELTRRMLAYSGQGKFVVELVNLSEVIGAKEDLILAAVPAGVLLRFEFADGLPSMQADMAQLERLVMNLVVNGVEAIGTDAGAVTVRTGIVDLGGETAHQHGAEDDVPAGKYLFLEVQDTGGGMDESTRAMIFDPFFSTKSMGRGLGLAATLGIVRAHGGTIRVQSAPANGSTFTALFPTSPVCDPRLDVPKHDRNNHGDTGRACK